MTGRQVLGGLAYVALMASCGLLGHDHAPTKTQLQVLLDAHATRDRIAEELGTGYTFYEKRTAAWESLEAFLRADPPSGLVPVRRAVRKYPKVMYYTTMWQMTWIFLDENEVIREYYLCAQ